MIKVRHIKEKDFKEWKSLFKGYADFYKVKINDDINILDIIDEGKELINQLYGPVPDDKGRMPDHPHHGHNH